jgi:hypothetical protein
MTSPAQSDWNLHILRGAIDDGLPEIFVGDVFDRGASFWSDAVLIRSEEETKTAVLIDDNFYRVNAEVVYTSNDPEQAACILDFGTKAISELGGRLETLPHQDVGKGIMSKASFDCSFPSALRSTL